MYLSFRYPPLVSFHNRQKFSNDLVKLSIGALEMINYKITPKFENISIAIK